MSAVDLLSGDLLVEQTSFSVHMKAGNTRSIFIKTRAEMVVRSSDIGKQKTSMVYYVSNRNHTPKNVYSPGTQLTSLRLCREPSCRAPPGCRVVPVVCDNVSSCCISYLVLSLVKGQAVSRQNPC